MKIESIEELKTEYKALNRVRKQTLKNRLKELEELSNVDELETTYLREIEELESKYNSVGEL